MKGSAGGGLGFLQRIFGKEVGNFGDEARRRERFFDILAFEVDVGIDLVGDAVVALVEFETDVVGCSADPKRFALDLDGSSPNAQMVARSDDADGLGVGPAVVLRPAEEVKLA